MKMRRISPQGRARERDSLPTVEAVAAAIGLAAARWPNQCHKVACLMLKARLVAGVERYGHYYGPVAPGHPRHGQPFQRHGWIETPNRQVIDPTRWAFERVDPYIYCGSDADYDPGGQRLAAHLMRSYPAGPLDPALLSANLTEEQRACRQRIIQLELDGPARDHLASLTGGQVADFNLDQVHWLGNLPLALLGDHAAAIFGALSRAGHVAMIPVDNWRIALDRPLAAHRSDTEET